MLGKSSVVDDYLKVLPQDRREALQAVREVFLKNLDPKYKEGIQYGGIGYYVPHSIYPAGYHCDPKQPLPFGGIANRKHYMTVGLMCIYGGPGVADFKQRWAKTGKKLDMGASCIRFRKLEDLALDVIAETLRKVSVSEFISFYENAFKSHARSRRQSTAGKKRGNRAKTGKTVAKSRDRK